MYLQSTLICLAALDATLFTSQTNVPSPVCPVLLVPKSRMDTHEAWPCKACFQAMWKELESSAWNLPELPNARHTFLLAIFTIPLTTFHFCRVFNRSHARPPLTAISIVGSHQHVCGATG